ncbi:hypothetical protein H3Z85_15200 [Chryseobacterium indologenes]|uniref:hypothetical protein n=1 Tax=Chryseobacterium indologenes TaxID=253 RepID=UPI0003E0653F|nr:hypothetical protein [Chryseobacterium indologenes]QPQ50752.1 hypothetical protein H3Z85_15200 [Chryseobacterium indologenes]GAE62859.1 hypothetical protein CIN01S_01_00800 [Chryseobacterium indologenes NBRC 14944]SFJ20997.1 hypothetical protein SAMN05421692_1381 [Chryseobacterium indologenes]SUX53468.1 Uncharacterised protein [Chryseobacterium indologenes]
METKESFTDFQEAVRKILEILNERSLYENKKILEKVNEILESSSILKRSVN